MLKQKTLHFILLLIFTTSLFVGGVSADTVCMAKCCSKAKPGVMHHTMGEQLASPSDCHSSIPSIPCDLKSKSAYIFPEYTLAATCSNFQNDVEPTKILDDISADNHIFQLNSFVQI